MAGAFISETLNCAMDELKAAYAKYQHDPEFIAEFKHELAHYVGRPSPVYHAKRMSREMGGAQIFLKREDLNHTGAHKINNTIGQALLAKRMGKPRIIAETGAGQHGVALVAFQRQANAAAPDAGIAQQAGQRLARRGRIERQCAHRAHVVELSLRAQQQRQVLDATGVDGVLNHPAIQLNRRRCQGVAQHPDADAVAAQQRVGIVAVLAQHVRHDRQGANRQRIGVTVSAGHGAQPQAGADRLHRASPGAALRWRPIPQGASPW